MRDDLVSSMVHFVSQTPQLHAHAVRKFYKALLEENVIEHVSDQMLFIIFVLRLHNLPEFINIDATKCFQQSSSNLFLKILFL